MSSNSIFGVWMGMEINLFSFIPLMTLDLKKNSENSIMIYFLIQSISSSMMIFSCFLINLNKQSETIFLSIFYLSLLMKAGVCPFHFWTLKIMEGLSWNSCFILLTIQKIIPMFTFSLLIQKDFLIILILLNSVIASITGLSTFSIRKIMGISSMNHMSILMMSILTSKKLFKLYFSIYTFMLMMVISTFNSKNLNFLFQIFKSNKMNKILSLNSVIMIFSMAGLPPFLGFIPKLMTIMKMMELYMIMPVSITLIFNSLAAFFYIRLFLSNIIMNKNITKLSCEKKNKSVSVILILSPMTFFL
uniref:NADH dehydrogenase subunit 2 n=1 Tax=Megalurothrips usitatus TaxID=439358 RepID=UPI0022FDA951|nr:NADH dehydrogenase subunit 2 [Megalurothrips usitatus]WAT94211.1 NADH dehydrogenase subunit 2 [Megalurothrips usitatus]